MLINASTRNINLLLVVVLVLGPILLKVILYYSLINITGTVIL